MLNQTPSRQNNIILIIDDHPVFSEGVAGILQTVFVQPEIIQVKSGAAAIKLLQQRVDIDWIFIDYHLLDITGIDVLKTLQPMMITASTVMMSGIDDMEVIIEALELGINGFIHKGGGKPVFQECVNVVEEGGLYLMPELKARIEQYQETVLKGKNGILKQLSQRRLDILLLISEGYSNNEIAKTVGITEATVKSHVSALMTIFDADNRSHCVAEARKLRIIP